MTEPLLLVGGSVRAAAMSARRAGFEPLAIDRFADADLRRICRNFQPYDELRQVAKLACGLPTADWMYTGPLENHVSLIEQLTEQRELLGTAPAVVRRIRNPWDLAAALRQAGLRCPRLKLLGEVPVEGQWLRKPLQAAGGFGIERFVPARSDNTAASIYFQEFIPGRSIGAIFVAANGKSKFVGATEQLLGPAWGGAREFQYVGSVGPITLSTEPVQALSDIGNCIASSFAVQGLFGVDAIVNDEGIWPVEVNPRYTASVEILERAMNIAAIQWHVAACRDGKLPVSDHKGRMGLQARPANDRPGNPSYTNSNGARHGKAVVYANRRITIDTKLEQELLARNESDAAPTVADIPTAGTIVDEGEPLTTLFAAGATNEEVEESLRTAIAAWR